MLHPAEATLYPREVEEAWWRDLEQSKVHLCAHPSVRPSVRLSFDAAAVAPRRRWSVAAICACAA